MSDPAETTRRRGHDRRPSFLITIDTEGDNAWSRPKQVTTENVKFLPRFQSLCESHGFKPTYLTNFEMACCPAFREFGRDILKRGTGEIGMHLHAWDTPPLIPLTADDSRHHPFLIEYPEQVMRDKVARMTDLLGETFAVKMTSHRAGRWSFDSRYARILIEKGYKVDCSVTPHVSWKSTMGDPGGSGGTDYSRFPELPYFMSPDDISIPGDSALLEVPVTIMAQPGHLVRRLQESLPERSLPRRVLNRLLPPLGWLRPRGGNLQRMLRILQQAEAEERSCVEFMLHSSEFMPGGSPTFPRSEDIESLYDDLEQLFRLASATFNGATLAEFYEEFCEA